MYDSKSFEEKDNGQLVVMRSNQRKWGKTHGSDLCGESADSFSLDVNYDKDWKGTHVHGVHDVLSSRYHHSGNDRVVGGSQNSHRSEQVLPASLQSSEQSTDQVAGHEDLGQLVVVLVVGPPDAVSLSVEVLNKVLHSLRAVRVGVDSLPVLQVEGRRGKRSTGVLSLGLGRDIGLLLVVILLDGLLLLGSLGGLLGLGGIGLLLSLGLGVLLGGLVLSGSLNVLPFSKDLGELGALDDAAKNKTS